MRLQDVDSSGLTTPPGQGPKVSVPAQKIHDRVTAGRIVDCPGLKCHFRSFRAGVQCIIRVGHLRQDHATGSRSSAHLAPWLRQGVKPARRIEGGRYNNKNSHIIYTKYESRCRKSESRFLTRLLRLIRKVFGIVRFWINSPAAMAGVCGDGAHDTMSLSRFGVLPIVSRVSH
jgi:hypothetical protein